MLSNYYCFQTVNGLGKYMFSQLCPSAVSQWGLLSCSGETYLRLFLEKTIGTGLDSESSNLPVPHNVEII